MDEFCAKTAALPFVRALSLKVTLPIFRGAVPVHELVLKDVFAKLLLSFFPILYLFLFAWPKRSWMSSTKKKRPCSTTNTTTKRQKGEEDPSQSTAEYSHARRLYLDVHYLDSNGSTKRDDRVRLFVTEPERLSAEVLFKACVRGLNDKRKAKDNNCEELPHKDLSSYSFSCYPPSQSVNNFIPNDKLDTLANETANFYWSVATDVVRGDYKEVHRFILKEKHYKTDYYAQLFVISKDLRAAMEDLHLRGQAYAVQKYKAAVESGEPLFTPCYPPFSSTGHLN
ncbi:hypothetical protein JCM5350_005460 [Sporobolomyces pararoseus]